MSVRINTNIEALTAQRNLGSVATSFAKSVERLSSGLRINRAADDAAGLAISQKLAAQVGGLNQAQRNGQDAISLVQTAEGALTEVHSMLQRVRELAVEASNSTLSASDQASIGDEIESLRDEIDRIARSTTFNGQRLLDGSLGKSATASGLNAITGALPGGAPIKAGSLAAGTYTLTATAGGGGLGSASTLGGATGLGTSNNAPGFSTATAIDSTTDGLLTQSGGSPANTVSGLAALGGGLGGVSTFVAGSLAADQYVLSVSNPGHASTLGGANTTATVTGATNVMDPVNGLWTTTDGYGTISGMGNFKLSAIDFKASHFGTGGVFDNPGVNSAGTLSGTWTLKAVSGGTSVADAVLAVTQGPTTINLVNNGSGVFTDAASHFTLDLSGMTGPVTTNSTMMFSVIPNIGTDGLEPQKIKILDGAGGQTVIDMPMMYGDTFQHIADAINVAAVVDGGAQVFASIGAHGLMLTSTGANSATNISVTGGLNALMGLGLVAPTSTEHVGEDNPPNANDGAVTGTGAVADATVATLTGATSHTVYTLTNNGSNVWSHAGSGFSVDLSGVTGGTLNPGWAMLGVGGGGVGVRIHSAANTVSGLAALGGGLGGVSTFVAGSLAADQYVLSVSNPGHASTLGGANTTATVTGATNVMDPVNGLWTTTDGYGTISGMGNFKLSAIDFKASHFGTGGVFDNPGVNSAGTLSGTWTLKAVSGGTSVADAVLAVTQGPTTINLVNNGSGVFTDAASHFTLDLSGMTGPVTTNSTMMFSVIPNIGTDGLEPQKIKILDGAGGQTVIDMPMMYGDTFQHIADAINVAAVVDGGAQVFASIGAHGLMLTSTGANSATNISVTGGLNALMGLGLVAPTSTEHVGEDNPPNANDGAVTGTGAVADATVATLTGATSHTVYTLTNNGSNVWSHAGSGFSVDLSGVTGGTLNPGWAMLGVGGGGTSITLTDENNQSAALSLTAGETFTQLINAINGAGLAIHAAFGSGGLKLNSTGTNLAATIKVRGSDDTLRGLGLEAADSSPASTINSVFATGSLGSAGGGTTITLTGTGAPVSLTNAAGVYSDSASGFSIDLSGAASLSSGTATINVSGTGAQFQVGANAGDFLAVSFADTTVGAAGYGNWSASIADFSTATTTGTGMVAAAQALLSSSDTAIAYISTVRGSFGALQNRLEHATASLSVASENLTASMSRIKDLDVASEMVSFTKTQILQQAGLAILAQANQAPQGILALLR